MFMAMPDASGKLSSNVASVASVADPFPIDALPPILRRMAEEVADVATVPPVLPACQALGIVSAALGSGLAIPSDRERNTFGNLYLIPAAESGSGKSVTFKSMMVPVYEYQDELRANAQASHRQLKVELFKLKGTLKRVQSDEYALNEDELSTLIARQEYIEKELQKWPKVICEDVTQAKLQVLLAANDERIFSASADARQVIQAVLNGKGDNPYLKAWSGDSTDVDRISRDAVPLREPRMAILWCPQPDLLMEMYSKRTLTDNGFLPRVLPCLVDAPPMLIGTQTRRVSDKTKADWADLVRGLFTTYHANHGGPFMLRRTDKAQSALVDYYNSIVERRRSELADVGPFAARWAEQAWRLAIVLHAGTYGADATKMVVKSATAENAIALMRFFAEHQLDLLRRTRANAKTETEQAIFNALALKSEITVRDLQLGALRRMNAEQITQVLERNVAAGKLNLRIHKENGVGRGKVVYFRPCNTCDTCDSDSSLRSETEPRRQG
jgi:hypothetical protein